MKSRSLDRWIWSWGALTLAVGLGADTAKPKSTPNGTAAVAPKPTTALATPPRTKPPVPEVIRNEEYEDVDGAVRPSEAPKARAPRPKTAWTSADIDAIVDRQLAASKTTPSPPTSDEAFLRRVALDLTGKPPAIAAIRQFGAAKGADKRAKVVDSLLDNPEFGVNWARYWRDVIAFRAPNENERAVDYPEFVTWLAGQLNANVPWNKIATAIITATGRTDENGATVFALAEEADPVELAGEVSRVFLGIQIQCAQCHDHPSDPWKRAQFHEFAAFFSGVKRRQVERPAPGRKAVFQISNKGPTQYGMTDLKNPEKKIPISPRFFLGEAPQVSEQVTTEGRLALAAGYVTSAENPWFARAFVNRVWTTLVGEGFYDLVDDLGPTRTANSSALLDGLADQWRDHDYDIRWLFRTILNTETYGRESRSTNTAAGRTPFAANVPSRLRADQIYDALSQTFNIDQVMKQRPAVAARSAVTKDNGPDNETKAEEAIRKAVDHTFGVDPSTPGGDVVGTIPQALYLMNSPLVTRAVQAKPGSMLGMLLASAGSPREAVDALYLKTLARRPNPKELATCLHHLDSVNDRREGFEDILWGLVNSTEFISRR